MLDAVADEVEQRLAQSLHFAVDALLNLPKADSPGQVARSPHVPKPWAIAMEDDRRLGFEILSEDETIGQIFGRSRQQLLILGEPGSGKTTSMVEIAKALVTVAQQDNTQPIPVLLNLSSWKKEQPILDWAVADLKTKYGVRSDLGREWLEAGQLLPLLDGLDEVRTDWQLDCARQLNDWMVGDLALRPVGLVVCCRVEEYERVVRQKLALWWAVCLQPLEFAQIEAYLTRFELETVVDSVLQDISLRELLEKPLFLSMLVLVAQQELFNLSDWQERETPQMRQEYLFDKYWLAAMQRQLVSQREHMEGTHSKTYDERALPGEDTVKRALFFVAKGMEKESKSEFLIEDIQGDWLLHSSQRYLYALINGTIYALVATFIGLLLPGFLHTSVDLHRAFTGAFLFGLMYSLIPISYVDAIKLAFPPKFSADGYMFGRMFGIMLAISVVPNLELTRSIPLAQISSLFFIVIFSAFLGTRYNIENRVSPNQGIKGSIKSSATLTLVALLFGITIQNYLKTVLSPIEDSQNLIDSIQLLVYFFISIIFRESGGNASLQHLSLRLVLWFKDYAPPRYDLLLDYCTERLLLQRIGGRYRFMHRTLQEYFAAMELD